MRTLGKAFWGLLLKHKGAKTSTYSPLLKRGNTEAGRQVGQEVWLRWPAQPLGGAAGRDVPRTCFCSLHLSSGSWCVAFLYPVHTLAQLQEMFVPSRPQVQPVSAMCLGFSSEAICAPKHPGMSSVFKGTGITWRSQGFLKLSCQEQGLIHKEMLPSHPPLGK